MIGFGIGAENFAISGTFFIVTSFISSGTQKKGIQKIMGGEAIEVSMITNEG